MSTVSPIVLDRSHISIESVQRVFDAACLITEIDDHGYLVVSDGRTKYVIDPDSDGDHIVMFAVFGLSEESSEEAQLQAAAAINSEYKMVRAAVHYQHDASGPRAMVLDYLLCTAGGVTAKTIIAGWQRFASILRHAVRRAEVCEVLGASRD